MTFIRNLVYLIKSLFHSPVKESEGAAQSIIPQKGYFTIDDIHAKYYSGINYDIFHKIVTADPTYKANKPDKMGKYGKWLLSLYQKNNLLIEDLYKAHDYLDCFDRNRRRLVNNSDINRLKSLLDLYDLIKEYLDLPETVSDGNTERVIKDTEAIRLYEDKDWLIIQPLTKEAAIIYGRGTQWCTAASHSHNYFEQYKSKGPLHILISRNDNRKYQFHLQTKTYCDETDRSIMRPIAESVGMSKAVAEYYQKEGWQDLFKSNISVFDNVKNQFIRLSDSYLYFNENGTMIYGVEADNVLRYRWGADTLYSIERVRKYNLIWHSEDKPVFEKWYDQIQLLNRGTVILKDGNKERVYSLAMKTFFEDVVEYGVNFDTLCEIFCSFTDHDRETDLSPIDKMIFAQAEDASDYIKYLNIFGSKAIYKKQAQYKSTIPLIQLTCLIITLIGAILTAVGFSNGGSTIIGEAGFCAFLISFIIFGFLTFTSKLLRNLITCITFISVNGILLYILVEYGPTSFFLTIFGFFILLFISGRTLTYFKSKINSEIPSANKSI